MRKLVRVKVAVQTVRKFYLVINYKENTRKMNNLLNRNDLALYGSCLG